MSNIIPIASRIISGSPTKTVSAKKLHEFLQVGRGFTAWITKRIEQYGFMQGTDYIITHYSPKRENNKTKGRPRKDYFLTLDMAKELAMVERNEKGREARQYFIECERRLSEKQPKPKQLPSPELSTVLQDAVKRKAHDLSLSGYDAICKHLSEWLKQWAQSYGDEEALKKLNEYDGLAGEMVFINAETLKDIVASASCMHITTEYAMKRVGRLEEETQRRWFNRS